MLLWQNSRRQTANDASFGNICMCEVYFVHQLEWAKG